jgi:hypothetical protein
MWEDNIKKDVKDRGFEGVVWIQLAQDRVQWQAVVEVAMNLWVLYRAGDLLAS